MALDLPNQSKMMQSAPAKKAFHFAATLEYAAEYIEAETAAEAEAIYHKIKKAVGGTGTEPVQVATPAPTVEPTASAPAPEQSTAPMEEETKSVN